MTEYIDLTPTWEEILPTWLHLVDQVIMGGCDNPTTVMQNFKKEMFTMAKAADKWNEHCKEQKDENSN